MAWRDTNSRSGGTAPIPFRPSGAAVLAVFLATGAVASEEVFTPEDIVGWERETFSEEVAYTLTVKDGRPAVHARCEPGGAMALYLEREIDLDETPVLEWSWRINDTFGNGIDETEKAGDDYAVRVYAVYDGGWRIWRSRAVNYVWASAQPEGATWPNAYTEEAMMKALRTGEERAGQWVQERRDLAADFREFHGAELDTLHGLAIMTDCDDVLRPIEGWYGEIRLRGD